MWVRRAGSWFAHQLLEVIIGGDRQVHSLPSTLFDVREDGLLGIATYSLLIYRIQYFLPNVCGLSVKTIVIVLARSVNSRVVH